MYAPTRFVLLLVGLVVLTSCAAAVRSRPVVEFPTPESLKQLASVPAALPVLSVSEVPAGGWSVEPSRAAQTANEPWQPADSWGRAFQSAVSSSGRQLKLTRAMACVAGELGRLRLESKKEAPHQLQEFILGACGALASRSAMFGMDSSIPAEVPEEEILNNWRGKLGPELLARLPPDATEAGFWFGRRAGQALMVVTYAQLRGEMKPFSLIPDADGTIAIEGRVAADVAHFAGYINQGRTGVESCLVDPGVPRPQFRIVCTMAAEDRTAWVQLVYVQPRRALAAPFMQVLVRRTPSEPLAFTETSADAPESISDPDAFSRAVLIRLNAVRARAQMPSVQLAEAQSSVAAAMAGHYFSAAMEKGRETEQDLIALGLLAGWQVPGVIRDGSFLWSLAPFTRDPGRWLSSALSTPIGRAALLDADIEQIALGPLLLSNPEGLGVLVTAYRFHRGSDHSKDRLRLFLRASSARQSQGLAPPRSLGAVDQVLEQELARVHTGELQPREALEEVLSRGSAQRQTPLHGFLFETTSLEALEIPEEILKQPVLRMALGVTHHKPAGAAWAQLVILVVYEVAESPEA
jgi:hypothetical protein